MLVPGEAFKDYIIIHLNSDCYKEMMKHNLSVILAEKVSHKVSKKTQDNKKTDGAKSEN